jgi:hypothetical protein
MDNAATVFFDVNDWGMFNGMFGKWAGDSVEGRICESNADDVVQGLSWDVAWGAIADKSSQLPCSCGGSTCRIFFTLIVVFNNGELVGHCLGFVAGIVGWGGL